MLNLRFDAVKERATWLFSQACDDIAATGGIRLDHTPGTPQSHQGPGQVWYRAACSLITKETDELRQLLEYAQTLEGGKPPAVSYAQHEAVHSPRGTEWKGWHALVAKVQAEGVKRIQSWDVRCAPSLISLFPGCAPQSFVGRQLEVDQNDAGDWIIRSTGRPLNAQPPTSSSAIDSDDDSLEGIQRPRHRG